MLPLWLVRWLLSGEDVYLYNMLQIISMLETGLIDEEKISTVFVCMDLVFPLDFKTSCLPVSYPMSLSNLHVKDVILSFPVCASGCSLCLSMGT